MKEGVLQKCGTGKCGSWNAAGFVQTVMAAHVAEGSLGGAVVGAVLIPPWVLSLCHPKAVPIPSQASAPAARRGFSWTTLFPGDLYAGFWR